MRATRILATDPFFLVDKSTAISEIEISHGRVVMANTLNLFRKGAVGSSIG
jgi:hypothetical protein